MAIQFVTRVSIYDQFYNVCKNFQGILSSPSLLRGDKCWIRSSSHMKSKYCVNHSPPLVQFHLCLQVRLKIVRSKLWTNFYDSHLILAQITRIIARINFSDLCQMCSLTPKYKHLWYIKETTYLTCTTMIFDQRECTHPDFSNRLHRSHITQYHWCYCKMKYYSATACTVPCHGGCSVPSKYPQQYSNLW